MKMIIERRDAYIAIIMGELIGIGLGVLIGWSLWSG